MCQLLGMNANTPTDVMFSFTGFATRAQEHKDGFGIAFFEDKGVRLFVDGFSLQYLNGVTIDYVSSMQGSGFTFSNPNATGGCGCGSSFTA